MAAYKCGFVNIFGYPNVGKSTLMNKLVGEKLSIVTPKVQTTRQRIRGILSGKDFQIVFSDTPGILKPRYELQKAMTKEIDQALKDADIILYMVEASDDPEKHLEFLKRISKQKINFFLLINKIDLTGQDKTEDVIAQWQKRIDNEHILPLSALHNFNLAQLLKILKDNLPVHEPYFETDIITDKSEKFIASEIIREKIFLKFREEIPYHTEVIVTRFVEEEEIIRLSAEIFVSRESQKPILIGKGGLALKELGSKARTDLEYFFNKKVFLELFVKVRDKWRDKKVYLKQFGYDV